MEVGAAYFIIIEYKEIPPEPLWLRGFCLGFVVFGQLVHYFIELVFCDAPFIQGCLNESDYYDKCQGSVIYCRSV